MKVMFRHNTQDPKSKNYDICIDDYMNKPFTPEDDYSETDREIVVKSTNHSKNALANLSEALSKMKSKKGISNEESDIQYQNQFNPIPKSSKPPIVYRHNKRSLGFLLPKIKVPISKKNLMYKDYSIEDVTQAVLTTAASIDYNAYSAIKNRENVHPFLYPSLVEKKERVKNTPKNDDHSKKPVNTENINKRYPKPILPVLPETLSIGSGNTVSLTPAHTINSSINLKVVQKLAANPGLTPQKLECKPYENMQSKNLSDQIKYMFNRCKKVFNAKKWSVS